jgi:GntR family transcriptional regulator
LDKQIGVQSRRSSEGAGRLDGGAAPTSAGGKRRQRIELSDSVPTPLFHQLFLVLREQIVDGTYPYGSFLPGEQQLAAEYDVARVTAKQALDKLATDGLVKRRRGSGTSVVYRLRPSQPTIEGSVDSLLNDVRPLARQTIRVLSFEYIPAPHYVADALRLSPGDEVQRVSRVRRTAGKPFSLLTTYVLKDIGNTFGRADLAENSLLTLLERAGVKVTSADQRLIATLADARSAELLDVEVGAPLLKIVRTIYDGDKRPVELLHALFRPDLYQYRMLLSRNFKTRNWE